MNTTTKDEATAQWFDNRNAIEAERDAQLQDEQHQRDLQDETDDETCIEAYDPEDRDDLIDDGRSDGYGESYSERNT